MGGKVIRVVQFGVGPAGAGIVRFAARKSSLKIVGAVDLLNVGADLGEVAESIEPIVAKKSIKSPYIAVKAGQAAGVRQVGRGYQAGLEIITLEFEAYMGARESYDAVYIEGTPSIEIVIKGGVHGDLATAAMIANSIPRAIEAPPGLLTMKDIPPVCALPE